MVPERSKPPTRHFLRRIPNQILLHPLIVTLRCILACILALILAPFLAPVLTQTLPSCLIFRFYERFAVYLISIITALAAVHVDIHPRTRIPYHSTTPFLPPPLVRMWASPMPHARIAVTYDQPGTWMTDQQLSQLIHQLETVAYTSIGQLPTHRLFNRQYLRDVMNNRVICLVKDEKGPLAFTAMAYLQVPHDVVVHLGLTMIAKRARGKRLQSTLFTKTLLMAVVNLARFRYYITNVAASPAGIGNVCDYFFDCFPSYEATQRAQHHVTIARHVLATYRYEFGCSENARFDERCFVVHASNEKDGGGTHQFIKADGEPVSKHRLESCNRFVENLIDFSAGDELFQVATFNFLGSLVKYLTASKHKRCRSAKVTQ